MIEFSRAVELTLSLAKELSVGIARERVEASRAVGRVLAEDVRAEVPVPLNDYSAMDGYAVRTADFAGTLPVELLVCGEQFAGSEGASLVPGASMRIFTGAPLPVGADAVIMQENVTRVGDRIVTAHRPVAFDHVRQAGEDLAAGAVALRRGQRVTAFTVGLLATLEQVEVSVGAAPRVGILCTGDELRAPGRPGAPGLAESNSVSLAALVALAGGKAERLPLVTDSLDATCQALEQALVRYDVVLTVGGVSVGDHDYVRPALARLGAEPVFSKVRMKPGKPITLMRKDRCAIVCLPGNPASAQVTFALFGVPLLRALQGDARALPLWRDAKLAAPLKQKPDRRNFYRALLEGAAVRVLPNQASGASTAMAWANCLLSVDGEVSNLEEGAIVSVLPYVEL